MLTRRLLAGGFLGGGVGRRGIAVTGQPLGMGSRSFGRCRPRGRRISLSCRSQCECQNKDSDDVDVVLSGIAVIELSP